MVTWISRKFLLAVLNPGAWVSGQGKKDGFGSQ